MLLCDCLVHWASARIHGAGGGQDHRRTCKIGCRDGPRKWVKIHHCGLLRRHGGRLWRRQRRRPNTILLLLFRFGAHGVGGGYRSRSGRRPPKVRIVRVQSM